MGKKKAHQVEADANKRIISVLISEVVVKHKPPNNKSANSASGSSAHLDGIGMHEVFHNISNVVVACVAGTIGKYAK